MNGRWCCIQSVPICRLYFCIKLEETSLFHYVLIQQIFVLILYANCRDSSVGISTRYGLDGPGIESRWGARFSAPVQTGPGTHPASCTMGTGSFPGIKRTARGADHSPHLQCRGLKLGRAIPLHALRVLVACYRETFTFTRATSITVYTGRHNFPPL